MISRHAIIECLIEEDICKAADIKGASFAEVKKLEAATGKALPAQYREFLFGLGNGAGDFFKGRDIFLSSLKGLREDAIDLLKENQEEAELNENQFVFSMHQGYEFTYFGLMEGDDPPVYQYVEGIGPPVLTWHSLSEFLRDSIAQHARPELRQFQEHRSRQ